MTLYDTLIFGVRVLLVVLGVLFAVPSYADAYRLQQMMPSRSALRTLRRHLAWAIVCTIIAAVGLIGWGPR